MLTSSHRYRSGGCALCDGSRPHRRGSSAGALFHGGRCTCEAKGVPCCQLWKVSKYPRNQAKWLINAHRSWSIVHLELKLERVLCVSCGTLRVCLFFDTGAQKRSILYGLVVWLSQNFKIPNQRVDIGWHGWTDHASSDFCCFPFSWLNFCIWLRLLHIVGLNFSVIWMGVQCALTMGNCRYRPVASSTPALLMFWRPPMWPERTGGSCAGGRMWGGVDKRVELWNILRETSGNHVFKPLKDTGFLNITS